MISRCHRKNTKAYPEYGGRGITVFGEWKNNFQSFYDWAMANGYRDDLSIDRIDVNGNYCPKNCRWATRKTQANNTRRNAKIEYKGISRTLEEWSEFLGIKSATIRKRLKYGWCVEKALYTPVRGKFDDRH